MTLKKTFLFVMLCATAPALRSQNLVQNPGLDLYITCPGFGQFGSTWIPFWEKPTIASSDYYHYNCPGLQPTVQQPRSGEGYAGIILYNYGTEYREYITGTFSTPLVAGTVYDVEFWVSLNNGYIQAIEEAGAYMSVTAPGPFANSLHIPVTPQVENTSGALNDTTNWKRVYGQYTASGGEQFITIGNFHDDAGTTITQPGTTGSYGSYYFIDDVSVSVAPASGIAGAQTQFGATVYTDDQQQLNIVITGKAKPPLTVTVYDMTGRKVLRFPLQIPRTVISQGALMPGVYVVVITDEDGHKWRIKKQLGGK